MSEATNEAVTEERLVRALTNEPSEPVAVGDVFIVFQRPRFQDKYKGRVWATKRLKEFGVEDEDDDPEFAFYIRYWGTLNTFVKTIYVPDEDGKVKLKGKRYSEYPYDRKTDLDYGSVFEKYVLGEIYENGGREDEFVAEAISAHMAWSEEMTEPTEEEVKNS